MTWTNLEGPVYWTLFVAAFLAVAVWESYRPKTHLASPAERRWSRHGLLLLLSAIAQGLLFRVSPVVLAVAVEGNRHGLLNQPSIPFAVRCGIAVLLIDLSHYVYHRLMHAIAPLWRLHEVHHSDTDYDVSTAARFHPIEVVLTQGCNLALVIALTPPPVAVFVAEMLAVIVNLFAHANASLPPAADRLLRRVFITPDMHRIHHSDEISDQSANLGQIFCWWDRLFGTYRRNSAAGHEAFRTGLRERANEGTLTFSHMLGAPFQTRDAS